MRVLPKLLEDTTDIEYAYATRKLTKTYAGPCMRVRRSSDGLEVDIGFYRNSVDESALTAHCGSGDGYVSKWYSQVPGKPDVVQLDPLQQPRIVISGVIQKDSLGKPSLVYSAESATTVENPYLGTGNSMGYEITQSSALSTASNAFNKTNVDNSDCWISAWVGFVAPQWLQIMYPVPVTLVQHSVTSRVLDPDPAYPLAFSVLGSNDGTTWTEIPGSSQSGLSWTFAETKTFAINSTIAYRFFRLNITQSSSTQFVIVAEWRLFTAPISKTLTTSTVSMAPATVSACVDARTTTIATLPAGTTSLTYPPTAGLTANTTTLSGQLYVASASSSASAGTSPFYAFDSNATNTYWQSASVYSNPSGATYTGGTSTIIDGIAYPGEWLQLDLPEPILLERYSLEARDGTGVGLGAPKNYVIAASNDNGATWTRLDTRSLTTTWDTTRLQTFTVPTSGDRKFAQYRLCVANPEYSTNVQLRNWVLFAMATTPAMHARPWPPRGLGSGLTTFTNDLTYSETVTGQAYGNGVYTIGTNVVGTQRWNTEAAQPAGTYALVKAFDDSFVTSWAGTLTFSSDGSKIGGSPDVYVQITLPVPIMVKSYAFIHNFRTHTFEGSTDGGATWTVLHTWTDVHWSPGGYYNPYPHQNKPRVYGYDTPVTVALPSNTSMYNAYRIVSAAGGVYVDNTASQYAGRVHWFRVYDEVVPAVSSELVGFTRVSYGLYAQYALPRPKLWLDVQELMDKDHNSAVATWGGAAAAASAGVGRYPYLDKTTEALPFVAFRGTSSTDGSFLNFGTQTFNINTNGGFTFVGMVRFRQINSWERIFDFNNGSGIDNLYTSRSYQTSTFRISGRENTTSMLVSEANTIVDGTWQTFTARLRKTAGVWDVSCSVDGSTSTTLINGGGISDKTFAQTYVGRSGFAVDTYASMDVRELMFFDSALTDAQLAAARTYLLTKFSGTSLPYRLSSIQSAQSKAFRPTTQSAVVTKTTFGSSVIQTYPPSALTASTTTLVSGDIYTVSSSTQYDASVEARWKAFDGDATTTWWTIGGGGAFATNPGFYNGGGTNTYIGTGASTTVDGVVYYGDWLQLELPRATTFARYSLKTRPSELTRGPKDFVIAGSSDGIAWTTLDARTGITGWTTEGFIFPVSLSYQKGPVKFVRLVVTATSGSIWLSIADWKLYSAPPPGTMRASTLSVLQTARFLDTSPTTAAACAFSVSRKLRALYVGPCCRIRNASGIEKDIYWDSKWNLDQASLLSHCGAGDGYVSVLYDQSGNGRHAVQSTQANQPRLVVGGVLQTQNGRPALVFNGTSSFMPFDGTMLAATNYSVFVVQARTTSRENNFYLCGTAVLTNTNLVLGYRSNTALTHAQYSNDYDMVVPGYTSTTSEIHVFRHSSSVGKNTYRNGTLVGSSANTSGLLSFSNAGLGRPIAGFYYQGLLQEVIIYTTYLPDATRATLDSNILAHYGL